MPSLYLVMSFITRRLLSMTSLPATPGYRLNPTTVLRDLYRLSAALLSLEPIAKITARKEDHQISMLSEWFAEDEIVHLLVSTAVSNRLQLEHMRNLREDPDERSFEPLNGTCGRLYQPADDAEGVPLEFREACNKIIHAEQIELANNMEPVLRLDGKQNKTRWHVAIHVLDYIEISVRNFEDALT
jgi:hypothetical protein